MITRVMDEMPQVFWCAASGGPRNCDDGNSPPTSRLTNDKDATKLSINHFKPCVFKISSSVRIVGPSGGLLLVGKPQLMWHQFLPPGIIGGRGGSQTLPSPFLCVHSRPIWRPLLWRPSGSQAKYGVASFFAIRSIPNLRS